MLYAVINKRLWGAGDTLDIKFSNFRVNCSKFPKCPGEYPKCPGECPKCPTYQKFPPCQDRPKCPRNKILNSYTRIETIVYLNTILEVEGKSLN